MNAHARKLTLADVGYTGPSAPLYVIGIDPGPTTGVAVLQWCSEPDAWNFAPNGTRVFQCNHGAALDLFDWLSEAYPYARVAIERWVIGNVSRASKKDGQITRDLIGRLWAHADHAEHVIQRRSASDVKPWATDDRLAHARLLDPTKGMGHARDAARHALYSAVKDYGAPDPMSRKAGAS